MLYQNSMTRPTHIYVPFTPQRTNVTHKLVCFSKRVVRCIFIALGTILPPITALAAGIKTFHYTHHKGLSRSARIIAIVTSMVYPLPIIGPFLAYEFGNNQTFDGLNILSRNSMNASEYLIQCTPFMSSFLTCYHLTQSISNHFSSALGKIIFNP